MAWFSYEKVLDHQSVNPMLKSQNLTTFGFHVYSCYLNYFLTLDPKNLQISFQSICFEYFRAFFIISRIQQDENTCESLSHNWVENVCEPWVIYFICYKNCMLYWLIFELEVEPHLTFFYQELQTSEDWYATNLNPCINRSRQQRFTAGSPSLELTNCRSGLCNL